MHPGFIRDIKMIVDRFVTGGPPLGPISSIIMKLLEKVGHIISNRKLPSFGLDASILEILHRPMSTSRAHSTSHRVSTKILISTAQLFSTSHTQKIPQGNW